MLREVMYFLQLALARCHYQIRHWFLHACGKPDRLDIDCDLMIDQLENLFTFDVELASILRRIVLADID